MSRHATRRTTTAPTASQVYDAEKRVSAAWQRFTWTDKAHEASDLAAYTTAAAERRAIDRAYQAARRAKGL